MTSQYQPWLHRLAVTTAVIALCLPITIGALVTTYNAGMAFRDWPGSDGHNMLMYPWLKSFGDKFLEHGHRLAGVLVGVISIVLAIAMWFGEKRRWAKCLGVAVLLCVIAQGLLGGQRVLLEATGLAMLHGLFGAWVFALMSIVGLVTSRHWFEATSAKSDEWNWAIPGSAALVLVSVQLQWILGGMLRHHGRTVFEHMGFAFVVLLSVMWLWVSAYTTGIPWLKSNALAIVFGVLCQICLGAGTYVAKFGFGDYIAQLNSPFQVWSRTGHTLLAMIVWMLAVLYFVKVLRIQWSERTRQSLSSVNYGIDPAKLSGGAG